MIWLLPQKLLHISYQILREVAIMCNDIHYSVWELAHITADPHGMCSKHGATCFSESFLHLFIQAKCLQQAGDSTTTVTAGAISAASPAITTMETVLNGHIYLYCAYTYICTYIAYRRTVLYIRIWHSKLGAQQMSILDFNAHNKLLWLCIVTVLLYMWVDRHSVLLDCT